MIDNKYIINKVYEKLDGEYSVEHINFVIKSFWTSLNGRIQKLNSFIMGIRIQGFGSFEIHGRKAYGRMNNDPERAKEFVDRYEYYKAQLPEDHYSKLNKAESIKRYKRLGIYKQNKNNNE